MTRGFHRLYGSNPLHLLAHLALFTVAGFSIDQIIGGGGVALEWIVWFLGAALLHDLVLVPLYSGADRLLEHLPHSRARAPRGTLNHLRVPAVVSLILLVVYFPLILGYSATNYHRDTGHALAGYTRNWLLITAGVFLASALVYAVRVGRSRRAARPPRPPRPQPAAGAPKR